MFQVLNDYMDTINMTYVNFKAHEAQRQCFKALLTPPAI